MNPLDRAIAICGTQSELARRATGKPSTGHVYHWRNNGVSESVAVLIERAVAEAIAESPEAAARAEQHGGAVTVEELRPDLTWTRDERGAVISFTVRINPAEAA